MPLHPSKKMKTIKREVNQKIEEILVQAFTNPNTENKPPSLVMQNFRTKAVAQGYTTPNLKSKGNVAKVLISTIPKKNKIDAFCDLSSFKKKYASKILVLKTQVESKIIKIQQITDKCIMMCQKRLLIDHQKSKILQSMKDHQQIIKVIRKNDEWVKEIQRMIKEMNEKRDQIRLEVVQLKERIDGLLLQKNEKEKELQNEMEIHSRKKFAVERRIAKKTELQSKMRELTKQFRINEKLSIFSRDLFDTIILQAQILNSIELNRMRSPSKIMKIEKDQIHDLTFSLCFCKNNGLFGELPPILIIICRLYIQIKLRNINKVLLNKISYFCPEVARVFDLGTFKNMVKQFYVLIFPLSFQEQYKTSKDQMQKRSKEELNDEDKNGQKISANLILSSICECGKYFFGKQKLNLLMHLLQKHFRIYLKNVDNDESCSRLCFLDEKMEFQRSNNNQILGNQTDFKDEFLGNKNKKQGQNFYEVIKNR